MTLPSLAGTRGAGSVASLPMICPVHARHQISTLNNTSLIHGQIFPLPKLPGLLLLAAPGWSLLRLTHRLIC